MQQLVKELQELRDQYNNFLYFLPEALLEVDILNVRLSYMNRMAYIVFGYAEDDFAKGIPLPALFADHEYERAVGIIKGYALTSIEQRQEYIRSGKQELFEFVMRRKDGTTFSAEAQASFVLDKAGVPHALRTLIRDITERKRAASSRSQVTAAEARAKAAELLNDQLKEELRQRRRLEDELRHKEKRYAALLAIMPAPALLVRRDGTCSLLSGQIFQKEQSVASSPDLTEIIPTALIDRLWQHVAPTTKNNSHQTFHFVLNAPASPSHFEARFIAIDTEEMVLLFRRLPHDSTAQQSDYFVVKNASPEFLQLIATTNL